MNRAPCSICHGARLKPEILAVTIKDQSGRESNIHQFCELTIAAAAKFVGELDVTEAAACDRFRGGAGNFFTA